MHSSAGSFPLPDWCLAWLHQSRDVQGSKCTACQAAGTSLPHQTCRKRQLYPDLHTTKVHITLDTCQHDVLALQVAIQLLAC